MTMVGGCQSTAVGEDYDYCKYDDDYQDDDDDDYDDYQDWGTDLTIMMRREAYDASRLQVKAGYKTIACNKTHWFDTYTHGGVTKQSHL